jgi:membrane protein YdbS with pleckstrin-like domain
MSSDITITKLGGTSAFVPYTRISVVNKTQNPLQNTTIFTSLTKITALPAG